MNTVKTLDAVQAEAVHGSGAYAPAPLTLVRGQGARVWDEAGRSYLDFGTGIGVAALGHAHPALTRAVSEAAQTLMTCVNGYYHNDVRARLLGALAGIAPPGLNRAFLCNSGTEAVEGALKLARLHTGRAKFVAAAHGFHGRTFGALSATWKPSYRDPFAPLLPEVVHVPFNDVAALEAAVDGATAAVVLETVQGEAGIHPATPEFLETARRACDAQGALLVLDEVQCGTGRTGRWWACERYGVVPDALCAAKALGGGVPVGAVCFRDALVFDKGQHGSTYGGNPLACRAALAVIEAIQSDNLLDHISDLGAHFLDRLRALQAERPEQVREARGVGLMLAVELRQKAGPALKRLLERGVLAVTSGATTLRFLPPYIATRDEVDEAVDALAAALG
mgnify:CR=1 FL=1